MNSDQQGSGADLSFAILQSQCSKAFHHIMALVSDKPQTIFLPCEVLYPKHFFFLNDYGQRTRDDMKPARHLANF